MDRACLKQSKNILKNVDPEGEGLYLERQYRHHFDYHHYRPAQVLEHFYWIFKLLILWGLKLYTFLHVFKDVTFVL